MFKGLLPSISLLFVTVFAAPPSSTNYTLRTYDFGNGGGESSSATYKVDGSAGTQSGSVQGSTSYNTNPGEIPTQNANVPPAPTFTNPSSEYNRLKLVINTGGNPTDVRYAIAISPDNFSSITRYVQSDNSVGTVLHTIDYQTYTAWGGATGVWITGLLPATTYTVKVKAYQGNFSGSAYGPTASAATIQPQLSFSVATTTNNTPPFAVSFTGLTANTVASASDDALLTVSTNAAFGGFIYIKDSNSGLNSSAASFNITSATTDLSLAALGYGGQVISTGQISGGPVSSVTPFNGAGNNVGIVNTSLQPVASTSAPITTGSITVRFKAKVNNTAPAATDYSDQLTFIAAMMF